MTGNSLKLPLTNVYAMGDYTARFHIGSKQTPVNLLIDTGSSTLVLDENVYQSVKDQALKPTSLAQEVTYGIGGWDGPVVQTQVKVALHGSDLMLDECHVALVASDQQAKTFGQADGMLGLAYSHLNKSFDLSGYLQEKQIDPALTYPWPFSKPGLTNTEGKLLDCEDLKHFKQFLWQSPEQDLLPYFTQIEELGLTANKFAFYSKRSSIHVAQAQSTTEQLEADPLNQGYLILGDGEQHHELYEGEFQTVPVVHDCYYNVELQAIQLAGQAEIPAPPIEPEHAENYFSNAIVDTGASVVMLSHELFQGMLAGFAQISVKLKQQVEEFASTAVLQTGIDASQLNLAEWPDLHFVFKTNDKSVKLTCKPNQYWQINSPVKGKAVFKIISQIANWPNQSLLGLPLLNNYYVIFDRKESNLGVVKFASIK